MKGAPENFIYFHYTLLILSGFCFQGPDTSAGRAPVFEQGQAARDVRRGHAHCPREGRLRVLARAHSYRHPRLRGRNQNWALLLVRLRFETTSSFP